jgi:hypothetical protein
MQHHRCGTAVSAVKTRTLQSPKRQRRPFQSPERQRRACPNRFRAPSASERAYQRPARKQGVLTIVVASPARDARFRPPSASDDLFRAPSASDGPAHWGHHAAGSCPATRKKRPRTTQRVYATSPHPIDAHPHPALSNPVREPLARPSPTTLPHRPERRPSAIRAYQFRLSASIRPAA